VYVSVEKMVNVFLDYRAPMKEQPYYWPLRLQGKSREARKYVKHVFKIKMMLTHNVENCHLATSSKNIFSAREIG
jgi:hypothetical protein